MTTILQNLYFSLTDELKPLPGTKVWHIVYQKNLNRFMNGLMSE